MSMMIGGLPFLDFLLFLLSGGEEEGERLCPIVGGEKTSRVVMMIGPASPAWPITPFGAVQIGIDLKKRWNNQSLADCRSTVDPERRFTPATVSQWSGPGLG